MPWIAFSPAAVHAPSAGNQQPCHFLVIINRNDLDFLAQAHHHRPERRCGHGQD